MSADFEDNGPESERSGFQGKNLRELIDIVQGLYLQLSSVLLQKRTRQVDHSSKRGQDIDVAGSLKSFIDTRLSDQPKADHPPGKMPDSGEGEGEGSRENKSKTPSTAGADLMPNELSGYFKEHNADAESQHPLARKMRASTLEHFSRAIQLAREGDREGAYKHAEYAENSVRIACEYLSETECEALQSELVGRVRVTELNAGQADPQESP
jgi:hypothetical protein